MKIEATEKGTVVIHTNGRVERCESIEEAREVCHEMLKIMRTLRGGPVKVGAVPAGSLCLRGEQKKKKVRVTIDPDVEIIKAPL